MTPLSGETLNETPGTLDARLIETIGPDMAREVIDEFRTGWERDKVMARLRQQHIAQDVQRIERCTIDGLGQHTASIDITAYLYWHTRSKGQCWKDKGFFKEFLRDNPECRVRYRPRTASLMVQPLNASTKQPQPGGLVAA